jgi:hypothetical protein
VFLVNVPVAVSIALAARTTLPDRSNRQARFDHAGVGTFTFGFGALLFAVLRGDEVGWANVEVPVAAGAGLPASWYS